MDSFDGTRLKRSEHVIVKSERLDLVHRSGVLPARNYEGYKAASEIDMNVYRIDGATRNSQHRRRKRAQDPTAFASRPRKDSLTLYVIESRCVPTRKILAYDVARAVPRFPTSAWFSLSRPRTPDFIRGPTGDVNLWCAGDMAIRTRRRRRVVRARRRHDWPHRVAARWRPLCFGGLKRNRLFIDAASQSILRAVLYTPGLALGG